MKIAEVNFLEKYFNQALRGAALLFLGALMALLLANTFLYNYYRLLIDTLVSIQVGNFTISKPFLLWTNDGLMAVFFLLVGMEIKREILEGNLSSKEQFLMPLMGAIGGILVPAFIYVYINFDDKVALQGWAIPTATDIAFALGVLALLGDRVPLKLKLFLTSLAILDDIAAIVIISVFYAKNILFSPLLFCFACMMTLYIFNRRGVSKFSPYLIVGILMWAAMVKSGVHATLTGIILAMFIPLRTKNPPDTPLKNLERDIHPMVAYFILPLFAFCNSGINLHGVSLNYVLHDIPIAIALGLFVGKQLGIFSFCWIAVKMKITSLPEEISWSSLYGISALCGIGFTLSFFIGSLAFQETGVDLSFDERIGIMFGSLLSGIYGYFILNYCLPKHSK